jgi:very-short-patch-repair endonuclease
MSTRGALSLDRQCVAIGLPAPETEVRFHPVRKWRADYLWREPKLIVEVDGGVFVQGRHSRGSGVEKDCEKFAEAMVLGYHVLRVTTRHVKNGQALGWIEKLLNGRRVPCAALIDAR